MKIEYQLVQWFYILQNNYGQTLNHYIINGIEINIKEDNWTKVTRSLPSHFENDSLYVSKNDIKQHKDIISIGHHDESYNN